MTVEKEEKLLQCMLGALPESAKLGVKTVSRGYEWVVFYLPPSSLPSTSSTRLRSWTATRYGWDPQWGWLPSEEEGDVDVLFAMYRHLVSEANVFVRYFPALRDFVVKWPAFENGVMKRFGWLLAGCDREGKEGRRKSVIRVADALEAWLRYCVGNGVFASPDVLRIGFEKRTNEVEDAEACWRRSVMRDGLALAQRKVATRLVASDELEDSGRIWLEGLSETRKRRRKGWVVED